jgi:hypothetical protein
MDGLTQMLANGWPLALAGFFLGVLTGGLTGRVARSVEKERRSDDESLSILAAELRGAQELLRSEEADAAQIDETLKNLDEAIKRANGRLKLIAKAVKQAK